MCLFNFSIFIIYQQFLYFLKDDSDLDEIWDDTELIKAYDKAVNLAYVRSAFVLPIFKVFMYFFVDF